MATAPNPMRRGETGNRETGDLQLRKDRLIGLLALVVIAALMLLMLWLASLGEGPPMDTFPMMP